MSDPVTSSEADAASRLRLRGPAPPVARLSRKALAIGGAGLAASVAAAVLWSLATPRKPADPAQQAAPVAALPPEEVTRQPRDYVGRADAPALGPPLPGDLGRPILGSGRPEAVAALPTSPAGVPEPYPARAYPATPRPDPAGAALSASRTSGLFAGSARPLAPAQASVPAAASTDAAAIAAAQAGDPRVTSPERLAGPASRDIIQAGTIIPAALVTGLRSDTPGLAVAQVTADVHDSLGRGVRLIPAGARLIGTYDAAAGAGAVRLAVRWTRLILPSGRSLVLDGLPAADPQGAAGLQDGVDRHGKAVAVAAVLSTVLAMGAEAGAADEGDLERALRRGGGRAVTDVGQQAVAQALAQAPVLTVRPGAPLMVLVARDLVLEPYREP